jgi:hypothetical protein
VWQIKRNLEMNQDVTLAKEKQGPASGDDKD